MHRARPAMPAKTGREINVRRTRNFLPATRARSLARRGCGAPLAAALVVDLFVICIKFWPSHAGHMPLRVIAWRNCCTGRPKSYHSLPLQLFDARGRAIKTRENRDGVKISRAGVICLSRARGARVFREILMESRRLTWKHDDIRSPLIRRAV